MNDLRPSKPEETVRKEGALDELLQTHSLSEVVGAQDFENDEFVEESQFFHEDDGDERLQSDIQEEIVHYEAVVGALAFYGRASELQFKRMMRQLSLVSPAHQKLFGISTQSENGYNSPIDRHSRLNEAARANSRFINTVLAAPDDFLGNVSSASPEEIIRRLIQPDNPPQNPLSGFNAEKVHSTLCQLAREWSSDGLAERIATFNPIFEALDLYLPVTEVTRYQRKVMCPGSGLGRLPLEICFRGYMSLANEFSYFMLIMSNFMLNKTKNVEQYMIYPWIHQTCNVRSSEEQLKGIKIPDVWPGSLPSDAQFGCAAGDFLEISLDQVSEWDAVVTCFFMDTANNIIDYMEAIWRVLKPGGYWINIGPLLYHYADSGEPSLELTLDQVLHAVSKLGFLILQQRPVSCQYTSKRSSMMNVVYNTEFWVAQKPTEASSSGSV